MNLKSKHVRTYTYTFLGETQVLLHIEINKSKYPVQWITAPQRAVIYECITNYTNSCDSEVILGRW